MVLVILVTGRTRIYLSPREMKRDTVTYFFQQMSNPWTEVEWYYSIPRFFAVECGYDRDLMPVGRRKTRRSVVSSVPPIHLSLTATRLSCILRVRPRDFPARDWSMHGFLDRRTSPPPPRPSSSDRKFMRCSVSPVHLRNQP
jgi:hypothetical protein